MPKYEVTLKYTSEGYATVTVEADDIEQAKERAEEAAEFGDYEGDGQELYETWEATDVKLIES